MGQTSSVSEAVCESFDISCETLDVYFCITIGVFVTERGALPLTLDSQLQVGLRLKRLRCEAEQYCFFVEMVILYLT